MTKSDFAALKAQLREHEGEKLRLYRCSANKLTIGVGYNIEDRGISQKVSDLLLEETVDEAYADLLSFPWFATLDNTRQIGVLDFRFQLGAGKFREFKRFLAAMARKDYVAAAHEMFDSAWWKQTQKTRRERVQRQIRDGKDR